MRALWPHPYQLIATPHMRNEDTTPNGKKKKQACATTAQCQNCRRGRETGWLIRRIQRYWFRLRQLRRVSYGFFGILYSSRLILFYSDNSEGRQTVENHLVHTGTSSYAHTHIVTSSIMMNDERVRNPRGKNQGFSWDLNPRLTIKPFGPLAKEWKTSYISMQHCLEASAEFQLILSLSKVQLARLPVVQPWVDLFLTVLAKSFISTFPSTSVSEFHDQSWSLAFRTAWRTTCHDWAYTKVANFSQASISVQPWQSENQLEFGWGLCAMPFM